jgi:hypothetical protein
MRPVDTNAKVVKTVLRTVMAVRLLSCTNMWVSEKFSRAFNWFQ